MRNKTIKYDCRINPDKILPEPHAKSKAPVRVDSRTWLMLPKRMGKKAKAERVEKWITRHETDKKRYAV